MGESPKLNLYAADIAPNDQIAGSFLVKRKFLGIGKTGKPWLSLTLMDKTGEIDGRIWESAEDANRKIEQGSYLMLEGIGTQYMDRTQLKIGKWRILSKEEINPSDYLPVSGSNQANVLERMDALIASVQDPWIAALFKNYRSDSVFVNRFCQAPAAKSVHHAFIGGLLEHTVSMMELALVVADHYNRLGIGPVHRDLLLAGTFVHDVGKIDELSTEPGFPYTDAGQMIGHMYLGLEDCNRRADSIDGFPAELKMHLGHLIVSHHGELQFGAGRRPKTLEAMILHAIDSMDSRVQIFIEAVNRDAGREGQDANWTQYVAPLDRYLLRKPYKSS